jgi:cob(I)alamin adenosyltransferase
MLHRVQNDLFNVGSDLATPPAKRWEGMRLVNSEDIKRLEDWIDELNDDLEPLKEFILPGGGPVGAFFHQARTVCRRAERMLVRLLREEPDAGEQTMRYLNRLSDYLFVAGRWAAKKLGEDEYLWDRSL